MTILGRGETVRRLQEAKELTASLESASRPRAQGKPMQAEDKSWMGSLAS